MTITHVPGITVGHAHDAEAITGCTVILPTGHAVCGVDVRGGGPSTRETDILNPTSAVNEVHAIALCGGSAFGQAAVTGITQWLYEHNRGYNISIARVPIIPAAVILDLFVGSSTRWPDAAMGYNACANATDAPAEGCVGAGIGATVGKIRGITAAVKSGIGMASEHLPDGTIIGALVVCNAFGDVWRDDGTILAGVRDTHTGGFANAMHLMREEKTIRMLGMRRRAASNVAGNTTLAVVATDATLTKTEATRLAQMAQDALPRRIRPIHTPFDGDTVFALATCQRPALHMTALGSIAADVLAHAIERSITQAVTLGGVPSIHDL